MTINVKIRELVRALALYDAAADLRSIAEEERGDLRLGFNGAASYLEQQADDILEGLNATGSVRNSGPAGQQELHGHDKAGPGNPP